MIGQVRTVTDPNSKITSFEYEPFGGLVKTIDPNQNVVRIDYDRLGRKTELYDPDLGQISYTVDPFGRVVVQMSPKQRAKFQANGNLKEKTYSVRCTGQRENTSAVLRSGRIPGRLYL